jgi:hypothetical protein
LSATSCKEDVSQSLLVIWGWIILANYANFENNCPFTFEMNTDAVIKEKTVVSL